MDSSLHIVKQILSSLSGGTSLSSNALAVGNQAPATMAGTIATGAGAISRFAIGSSAPSHLGLSTLVSFLFSLSAIREWLKLFAIGLALDWCRRLTMWLYDKVYKSFFITAYFVQEDYYSYSWVSKWLETHPSYKNVRTMNVYSFGADPNNVVIEGEASTGSDKMYYRPSGNCSYSLWYKRHWIQVSRIENVDSKGVYHGETLALRILAWNRNFLETFLLDAKKLHREQELRAVCVYVVAKDQNLWRHKACRQKRLMTSVVLDPGIKESLLEDAKDFLMSKAWYAKRGIPFRRGYLLYGVPGSGKTSLIHSLASELGINVYILSLSTIGLDDTGLLELVSTLPDNCILLMEDIDAAFTQSMNRESDSKSAIKDEGSSATAADKTSSTTSESSSSSSTPTPSPPPRLTSRVTLSGLLNALDGVSAPEGRILFATTNKYSALDAALTRPGRLDLHVEFTNASKYQARELYRCFYMPEGADSGEKDGGEVVAVPEVPSAGAGTSRRRAPRLSRKQLEELGDKFADAIPEHAVSMASLQGYLMRYKIRPLEAVEDVGEWVLESEQKKKNPENKSG